MVSDIQFQLNNTTSCLDKLETNVIGEITTTSTTTSDNLIASIGSVATRLQSIESGTACSSGNAQPATDDNIKVSK